MLIGIELISGSPLPPSEQEDYLHLWRYIGHVIGVEPPHNPCRSVAAAKAILESIILHVLKPDGTYTYTYTSYEYEPLQLLCVPCILPVQKCSVQ